jgi:glycosyltransferase involved in cell wall biosynthesis
VIDGARIGVVVPAHDEEERIGATLASMPACVDVIVVVDDGSGDRTAAIVRASSDPRVRLVGHAVNRGVGAAIVSGYRAAFAAGADVVVVMGADGQMDPSELERLARPVVRGAADYAKGDRLAHAELGAMPAHRRVGNAVFSALTRAVTGLAISDSQCGYTAISRAAAARLDLDALWPGYGYPNDLLARAASAGMRVVDVPVRPIYAGEKSGIGLWEGLVVIPSVIARAAWRRARERERERDVSLQAAE